jgi:hypothetical protein
MDIGAEAINAIAELEKRAGAHEITKSLKIDDETFEYKILAGQHGRALGDIVAPPRPGVIEVSTLSGLVDAINVCEMAKPEDCVLQVGDTLTVKLMSRYADKYGHRQLWVKAVHDPLKGLTFGEYFKDLQRFVIGLQVQFLQTQELLDLIKLVGNLKTDEGIQVQDDGFSQTVTLRSGQVTAFEHRVAPRIKLIPWRTFPEVTPVVSEFLIRFKSLDGVPAVALFEIDGGKWKQETMVEIKKHLAKALGDTKIPILA